MYCQTWKLRVNIGKTKIVIFGKGRLRQGTTFYYEKSTIEIVKKLKYLGVTLLTLGHFIQLSNTTANKQIKR